MNEIESKLILIVKNHVSKLKDKEINMTDTFETIGADSLDSVEIIMEVEKEFNISIPDEKYEELNNLKSLVAYLQQT